MKKQLFLIALVAILANGCVGQAKMGRYHKNLLYEADLYFLQGDYYYASELYSELLKVEPTNSDILGKLGMSFYNLPTFNDRSVRYLELAVENGHTDALFYLARVHHENYRFAEAIALLEQYETKARRTHKESEIRMLKRQAHRAAEMVQTPLSITIHNLGPEINSSAHDYAPVWDLAQNRIFFTSRRRMDDESEKDYSEQFDENIYIIDLEKAKLEAVPAGNPLNSRTNDATVAVSHDGSELIVFRTSKDGLSGDLFITEKIVDLWGDLKKLDGNVNTKFHEASATFGNKEGTVLYFSSDRPGGYGGKDLYVSNKLPDGSWSEPRNLGETINTPYDEDAPFVAANGKLYFASRGHDNIGGYDIFVSTPSPTGWSEPENLGYPVNTPGDDIFFALDPEGKAGYFSSERYGGFGLQDIYRFVFNDSGTMVYKASVEGEDANRPVNAVIKLISEENGQIEGYYRTSGHNGVAIIPIQTNKTYTLIVEAEGYDTLEKTLYFETGTSDIDNEKTEKLTLGIPSK